MHGFAVHVAILPGAFLAVIGRNVVEVGDADDVSKPIALFDPAITRRLP
jgi:hypothetical protein